jgi:hypothetical protein
MILEKILTPIFLLLCRVIDSLPQVPSMGVTLPTIMYSVVQSAAYFLPVSLLLDLLTVKVAIWALEVMWKSAMRVKSFLPTMGV